MTFTFDFLGVAELNAIVNDYFVRFTDIDLMHKGAIKAFFKVEEEMFASEGGPEKWVPLTQKYKQWKSKKYGNLPIMQMTGALKNALTGKDTTAIAVQQVDSETAQLVIRSKYWANHQYGRTVPMRKTVNLTEEDKDFIIDAMLKATLGGRLSRLFSRR